MIVVKANSGRMIEKVAVPKPPKFSENIDIDINESRPFSPRSRALRSATGKVVRNISAVRVHMIKVSKNISNTPQSPCLTGSRVSDAECAMTEEPKPASLENTPRAIPFLITVAKAKPKRIVYVSCKPSTLARDLKILEGLSYKTEEVAAVDLFPRTHHIETVAKLCRE